MPAKSTKRYQRRQDYQGRRFPANPRDGTSTAAVCRHEQNVLKFDREPGRMQFRVCRRRDKAPGLGFPPAEMRVSPLVSGIGCRLLQGFVAFRGATPICSD